MCGNEGPTMTPPKRVLTEADLEAIRESFQEHSCRFENVTPEDMNFLKDLLRVYKETRSEVIKWVIRGIVYGILILLAIGLGVKYKGG